MIAPETIVAKTDGSRLCICGRNWNFATCSAEIYMQDGRGS